MTVNSTFFYVIGSLLPANPRRIRILDGRFSQGFRREQQFSSCRDGVFSSPEWSVTVFGRRRSAQFWIKCERQNHKTKAKIGSLDHASELFTPQSTLFCRLRKHGITSDSPSSVREPHRRIAEQSAHCRRRRQDTLFLLDNLFENFDEDSFEL